VSYFHGSNDGQKGMGLIMLILVGTVPTAYALNHTVSLKDVQTFTAVSTQAQNTLHNYETVGITIGDAPAELERFVSEKKAEPQTIRWSRWWVTSGTKLRATVR
jgi:PiT family inorganic phosphate transporter